MTARHAITLEVRSNHTVVALAGRRIVGMAIPWHDCNGRWVIMKSEVRPAYRRRGIATAMYRAIEAASGKLLVPAHSLSDDAFRFWKAYRPEAVADDLRHHPEWIGCKVQKNGRTARIISVSGTIAVIEFDDGDNTVGSKSFLRAHELEQHLLEPMPIAA